MGARGSARPGAAGRRGVVSAWAGRLLALLLAGALAPSAACVSRGGHSSSLRAVVLVSIDTLRPDHLGCYGYAKPTSPEIDRFREQAVFFRWAIAQAPSTLASHASMLTSLGLQHHGASIAANSALKPGVLTLAELLRRAGFATASFNGGGQLHKSWGLDRGFDVYESATDSSTAEVGEDTMAGQVAKATAWLDRIGDRPFFLFLHTYEVHHPYTPTPERLRQMESGYSGGLPDRISIRLLEKINSGEHHLGPQDLAHIVATYDAEIASADTAFGNLLQRLRSRGLRFDARRPDLRSRRGLRGAGQGRLARRRALRRAGADTADHQAAGVAARRRDGREPGARDRPGADRVIGAGPARPAGVQWRDDRSRGRRSRPSAMGRGQHRRPASYRSRPNPALEVV